MALPIDSEDVGSTALPPEPNDSLPQSKRPDANSVQGGESDLWGESANPVKNDTLPAKGLKSVGG